MSARVKEIVWLGSSRKDLRACPQPVRKNMGSALYAAQRGETDPAAKPLKGFGGARVMQIVERYRTDTYRAVYAAQFESVVCVLHVFKKKARGGKATPKQDIDLIRQRFADAKRDTHGRQGQDDRQGKDADRKKQR